MIIKIGTSILLMLVSAYSLADLELFKSQEQIDISNCEIKGHIGTCTYSNRATVDFSESIKAYSYDKGNVREGRASYINTGNLRPGQSSRANFVIGDDGVKVVLCSIDPDNTSLTKIYNVTTKSVLW